jgi:hypothetical protein
MVANLRTTADYVEVAYTPASAVVRNTAHYVEVLYTSFVEESVESTIVFSQTATKAGGTVFNRTVSQSISFDSGAFRSEYPGSLIQLTQSVSVETVLSVSLISDIEFDQLAIGNVNGIRPTSNQLNLSVLAEWKKGLPTETASSTITFTGSATAARPISSILAFTQAASAVVTILGGNTSSDLDFTQTVTFDTGIQRSLTSTLSFTQTVTRTVSRAATTVETDLSLGHEALHSFANKLVTIQAPWGAITKTIVLPSPLFQDAENLVDDLTIDFAEDGTLYTYIRTQLNRRLNYTFQLTRQKALEFQDFIDEFNSDSWKVTNWKGEVWKVKLVTNPVEFVPARRGGPCGPTTDVSITLEGEKLQ